LIDFSACGEPNYETNNDGKYVFEAMAGLDCDVIISKAGFKPYSIKVSSFGQRVSRQFEVKLRKISDEFVGKIVDAESNNSVTDVIVVATNPRTGLQVKTTTNKWGEYKLALASPEKYNISYSKAGYLNTVKRVTITSKTDKSQLGILSFRPSYSAGSAGGDAQSEIDDTVEDDTEVIAALDNIPDTVPDAMGNEGDRVESGKGGATAKGFAVQVAAYFDGREVKVDQYSNLQEIGNVYKMQEGEAEKVRVGIYTTKEEAEAARKEITKKGFAKAFIVSEEGEQSVELKIEEENEKGGGDEMEIPDGYETTAFQPSYKVRVATFRSTKLFDDSNLTELGEVERKEAGKFTIILLSGFKSKKVAKMMLGEVKEMGYDDAHLVYDTGENLEKVK